MASKVKSTAVPFLKHFMFLLCCKTYGSCPKWDSYSFFPIITDDKSVGSILLFLMINFEISANSQHSLTAFYLFNR